MEADHVEDGLGCLEFLAAASAGIDDLVGEELSLTVEQDDLAAGAEAWIDAEGDLLAERRGEQEFAEIVGEDTDRLLVRLLLVEAARLHFHGESDKSLEAVVAGEFHLLGCLGAPPHEESVEGAKRLALRRCQPGVEESLGLTASHCENPVGRGRGGRFVPVEVVLKLGSLLFLPGYEGRFDHSLVEVEASELGACGGIVVDPLGKDVACSGEDGGHAIDRRGLGIDGDGVPDIGGCERLGVGGRILCPENFGKRLQTEFLGDGRSRPFSRLEGEVDVLEGIQGGGALDLGSEFLGQEFALLEGGDDRLAPLVEGLKLLEAVADRGDLHLIEFASALLAVTGDEGDGGPLLEKDGCGGDLAGLKPEFLGNLDEVFFDHLEGCLD